MVSHDPSQWFSQKQWNEEPSFLQNFELLTNLHPNLPCMDGTDEKVINRKWVQFFVTMYLILNAKNHTSSRLIHEIKNTMYLSM